MRTRNVTALVSLVAVCLAAPAFGQSTLDMPVGEMRALRTDSGVLANPTNKATPVYQDIVHVPDSAWIRLYFSDQVRLGPGSFIRVTSLLDQEIQELDETTLAMWSLSSAYFNGDSLLVELVAGPLTTTNRVVLEQVAFETGVAIPVGSCGICGADNRTPSDEVWTGRLVPAGCTASVYNSESCLVSAGHCISGGDVIQFNVPDSSPNCSLNNPPVADQFPITFSQFINGGVGNDWAAMRTGTNNLGQTIYDRFGEFRPIATSPPGVGQAVDIWGYGVDSQCVLSQTQQHDDGNVTSVFSSFFEHNVDATFGNSGSAVIRNGMILGINTHCPCPNVATRVSNSNFVAGRETVCPSDGACCFPDGACSITSSDGCSGAGGVYQGGGTDCVPNDCPEPEGACCIGAACETLTIELCAQAGGFYGGDGTLCTDPGICDIPEGACCLGDGSCFVVDQAFCEGILAGSYQGDDSDCTACEIVEPCPQDLNGDGIIGFVDLLDVLSNWGPCTGCPQDLDGNGDVGFPEVLDILSNWGPCP